MKPFEKATAPLLISLQYDFGVSGRLKLRPELFEFGSQLAKVVNFAVKDHCDLAIFRKHRLRSPVRQIKNRQAAEGQISRVLGVVVFGKRIGPAMIQTARAQRQFMAVGRSD